MSTPPVALTIAGVDSSGGAGIHADLRTFAAHRVHGATAVAALTAQGTAQLSAVQPVAASFVVAQVDAVLDDLEVRAVKTGFLASADTVQAVGRLAEAGRLPALVVDPVLVRSDGAPLFDDAVRRAYLEALLPRALVATPNRAEAELLLGRPLPTVADMEEAAADLVADGPAVVVVKGGDADDEDDRSVDIMATADGRVERLVLPRVDTRNDRGSGCTFAAAVTARLALGADPPEAVRSAKRFVYAALVGAAGWQLGSGRGPLDQLGWVSRRPS